MDDDIQRKAWQAFGRLIDLDEAARAKALADVRQTQPLLASEIESLLRHDAAAGENSFWRRALPDRDADPAPLPERIGPYRIVRELGRGGMGVVYEALHVEMGLDKHVALKLLPSQRAADPQSIERFYREARLAASLHHTHIVPVLNAGIEEGRPWYAMAYVRGGPLSAVVRRLRSVRDDTAKHSGETRTLTYSDSAQSTAGASPLPEAEPAKKQSAGPEPAPPVTARPEPLADQPAAPAIACWDIHRVEYFRWVAQLGIQAAKGLDYAHRAEGSGVIHRDIKPANLLLDEEGTLWIADFGLARKAAEPSLTVDGHVLGTPNYMSPEQAGGKPVDHRTDIYSLGATLYELLTLRPVFSGSMASVLQQIGSSKEPDPVRRHNPAAPRDLEAIVEKAVAKSPARRYQSAAELADDLERWLANRPIRARRIGAVGRAVRWCRREPIAVLLLISLVVGSCTSLYFGLAADRRAHEADEARSLADCRANDARREADRADAEAAEASRQAKRADEQTAAAVANANESHRRLVAHHVSSGVKLLDGGDALAALPWFVEALRLDAAEQDRARMHRFRIAAASEASPKLLHAWFHTGRVRGLHLSSDQRRVITAGNGGRIEIHDIHTGQSLISKSFGSPIVSSSASASGERVAVSTVVGTTHIWDIAKDADLAGFLKGLRNVTRVLLSDDGQRLATLHGQREVRFWNVDRGEQLAEPLPHPNDVLCWSFSPDGRSLLTGTGGRAVPAVFNQAQIWDVETGKAFSPVMAHADDVMAVSWSADGRRVATGGWDNVAQVWDAFTGKPVLPRPVRHDSPVSQVLLTQDGRFLVTGSEDQTVRVWDIAQGTPIGPRLQHGGPVLDVRLVTDESCIASAGFDRSVRFWNAHDGTSPLPRLPHLAAVERVAITRDGLAITASEDGAVRVWDLCTSTEPTHSFLTGGCAELALLSPDGKRLLTVTGVRNNVANHFARVWDAKTGVPLTAAMTQKGLIEWADFSSDGTRIVTASHDGTAQLWNAADGAAIGEPLKHGGALFWATFDPDGKTVLTASADGTARVWDVKTCQERLRMNHRSPVFRAAFDRLGRSIATAAEDGTARIWNAQSGEPRGQVLHHAAQVIELTFSADGRRLATASCDKTARVWDTDNGQPLTPPLEHADIIRAIAFSADGERLATGSDDWTARIWSATTGEPLTPFLHHEDVVNRVVFDGDGTRVATACGGPIRANVGEARVWDAATGEPLTAWLRHGNDVYDCRFDSAGKNLYTASWDWRVRKWELALDERPLEELQRVAELSAGYRIDRMTGIASVESGEFRSRWPKESTNGVFAVARSPAALAHWHQPRSVAALLNRDWPLAAYHLAKLADARPDDSALLSQLATIQCYLGDREGYQAICQRLLTLWRGNRPELLSNLATVCLLDADQQEGLHETIDAVASAVEQNPNLCTWWHLNGALAYRLGKFDECRESLDRAKAMHGGASPLQDRLFQTMTLFRAGDTAAATELLNDCRREIDAQRELLRQRPTADPSPYFAVEILLREAKRLVAAGDSVTTSDP